MNGWIDLKERLPERRQDVLVVTQSEWIDVMTFMGNGWQRCCHVEELSHVTHWMQLPKKPNGEQG